MLTIHKWSGHTRPKLCHVKNLRLIRLNKLIKPITYSVPIICILVMGCIVSDFLRFDEFIDDAVYAESDNVEHANGGPEKTTATLSISNPVTTDGISGSNNAGMDGDFYVGRGVTAYQARTVTLSAAKIRNYTVTMTGSNQLTNDDGGVIDSIKQKTVAGADIASNSWGYYYGDDVLSNRDKLTFSPVTASEELDKDDADDNAAVSGYSKNLIFAANFDADAPKGEYRSQMKLSLTVEPQEYFTYSVTYYANSGEDKVENLPAKQQQSGYDLFSQDFTIPALTGINDIKRSGYKFLGWSTNSQATEADTKYAPGTKITLTSESEVKELGLYAVWEKIRGVASIAYMQDMTPAVCAATPKEGDDGVGADYTKQLIDKRDGKTYWVARLKDGNCWMTQNLDIDIPSGGFTSNAKDWVNGQPTNDTRRSYALSDMTSAWTVPSGQETRTNLTVYAANVADVRSWDQGLYVSTKPLVSIECGNNTAGQGLNNCTTAAKGGYTNVSSYTASTDPDFMSKNNPTGTTDANYNPIKGTVYDAHYLVGNYYQWGAATAGSGASTTVSSAGVQPGIANTAQQSICPAGWKLPTSGANLSTGKNQFYTWNQDGSFGGLLKYYGWRGTSTVSGQDSITPSVLSRPPLYFARTGYVNVTGYIIAAAFYGNYWSSTAYLDANLAYDLGYGDTLVSPAEIDDPRYLGFSVRCVAYPK